MTNRRPLENKEIECENVGFLRAAAEIAFIGAICSSIFYLAAHHPHQDIQKPEPDTKVEMSAQQAIRARINQIRKMGTCSVHSIQDISNCLKNRSDISP